MPRAALYTPSYAQGFAEPGSAYAANPDGANALGALYMPSMGATGLSLNDLTRYKNHGALTSMDAATDWVPTAKGMALDFDGTGARVEIPFSQQIAFSGNDRITISLLFCSKGSSGAAWLLSQGTEIILRYDDVSDNFDFILNSFSSNDRVSSPVSSVPDDTWALISCGYDGNELWISVDNGARTSVVPTGTYGGVTSDFSLGARLTTGGNPFTGQVSSVCIDRRSRATSEIKQMHEDQFALVRRRARVIPVQAVAPTGHAGPLVNGPILKTKVGGGLVAA